MQLWQSVLLGLVEGLTEFLPVSSTAHLLLTQRILGMQGEAANAARTAQGSASGRIDPQRGPHAVSALTRLVRQRTGFSPATRQRASTRSASRPQLRQSPTEA